MSLAAEEQPAGGKLMHPVGEPGSIDVSASLASTLAGFLSGASQSSWIFIFSDFGTFITAPTPLRSIQLPIVPTLICIINSSHSIHGEVLAHRQLILKILLGNIIPKSGHNEEYLVKDDYIGKVAKRKTKFLG